MSKQCFVFSPCSKHEMMTLHLHWPILHKSKMATTISHTVLNFVTLFCTFSMGFLNDLHIQVKFLKLVAFRWHLPFICINPIWLPPYAVIYLQIQIFGVEIAHMIWLRLKTCIFFLTDLIWEIEKHNLYSWNYVICINPKWPLLFHISYLIPLFLGFQMEFWDNLNCYI